jgi:hypothetical protein
MTRTIKPLLKTLAALSASLAFCASSLADVIVYDNSTGWLTDPAPRIFYATNQVEFGDQIVLGGTERVLVDLKLDYWLSANAIDNPNITATVTLYANDGPEVQAGFFAPGTVLGTSTGALTTTTLGYNVLTYTATTMTVLPDTFTYTITVTGLLPNERTGLLVSNPATVGSNFNDFWLRSEGTWNVYTLEGGTVPANFSARVTAVPEPTTFAYALLAGILGFGYLRLKRRNA